MPSSSTGSSEFDLCHGRDVGRAAKLHGLGRNGGAAAQREGRDESGCLRWTDTAMRSQLLWTKISEHSQTSMLGQQLVGQIERAEPLRAVAQQQRQQLALGERLGPPCEQPLPWAFGRRDVAHQTSHDPSEPAHGPAAVC